MIVMILTNLRATTQMIGNHENPHDPRSKLRSGQGPEKARNAALGTVSYIRFT